MNFKAEDIASLFPSVTKSDWLNQINKDLKGKPLEDLNWNVSETLTVSPLVHAEDLTAASVPHFDGPLNWSIGEVAKGADATQINRTALTALEGGAEALRLDLKATDMAFLEAVFKDIYIDYIGLHCSGEATAQNPSGLIGNLVAMAESRGVDPAALHGSLDFDVSENTFPDWRFVADFSQFLREKMPNWRGFTIKDDYRIQYETDLLVDQLAQLLTKGDLYLNMIKQRGGDYAYLPQQLCFDISIGKSYLIEIAKLRAFALVWYNILDRHGLEVQPPYISTCFAQNAYVEDRYTNMIIGTSMAMSAVLGGANLVTVRPFDEGRETDNHNPAFSARIARNVQHLLKLESGFDQLADPVAGSYYLEILTQQIATQVWQKMGF